MSSVRPPIIDIAPGESHIALRYPNKCFYVPQVFHSSKTFGMVAPLFINDINESPVLETIYGPNATYARDAILINNHPVRRVKLFGKVVGERYRDFGFGNRNNHIMVTIDDSSSSSRSQIPVKIDESKYIAKGFSFGNNYGKLIEICGVCTFRFGEREIRSDFVNVLGNEYDIHIEIDRWNERLEFRRDVLSIPWVYTPPNRAIIEGDNFTDEVRFEKVESLRRFHRENLRLSSSDDFSQMPDLVREDSMIINHRRYQESTPEIIEISDDEDYEQDSQEFQIKHRPILSPHKSQTRQEEEIKIIDIKEASIHIITELQLTIEFLMFIIKREFETFQLVDIYKDTTYFNHLTNFVQLQLALSQLQASPRRTTLKFQQEILFHKIRHTLQVDYKLISVTKSQRVKSKVFHEIYDELNQILIDLQQVEGSSIFDLLEYLDSIKLRYGIGDSFPYKALNSIIDYIITDIFRNRSHWKYDSKYQLWHFSSYIT
ncbi:telomere regulation protein Stn1-domain-containing protein [Scheffersomyces coipomensis]|uniref:telomere regulation protein Stn1-domain-containing protein n=1 Tax=Scheffersomyces coipomensis TaxID=1788519 RepID=UPI00315C81F1